MKTTITITCSRCGKDFQRKPSLHKISVDKGATQFYCSTMCMNGRVNGNAEPRSCAHCGTQLMRRPSDIRDSKTGLFFCTTSCAAKHNNPLRVRADGAGIDYRERAFSHYGVVCMICGFAHLYALEVHHIDRNRRHNKITNLAVLCANCHTGIHKGALQLP